MSSIADSLGGLVKSAGIVLAGTVVGNILGIIAEIFIPRALDPAVYGRLGLAYGIVSVVSSLAILGIPNGVTQFLSEWGARTPPGRRTLKRIWVLFGGSLCDSIARRRY